MTSLQFGPGGSAGGDAAVWIRIAVGGGSFNSAPAARPGGTSAPVSGRQPCVRFNSAPAARPGGTRTTWPRNCTDRRFNSAPAARPGGTGEETVPMLAIGGLQFGPGGSAGGDLVRECFQFLRSGRLQFGPGGSAGGDALGKGQLDSRYVASIRPRRLGRGGRPHRLARRRLGRWASIRPRRLGRGGPSSPASSPIPVCRFNSAPAARPGGTIFASKFTDSCLPLQFGPGGSAGGDGADDGGSAGRRAASIRPRRLGRGGHSETELSKWVRQASIRPRRLGRGGRGLSGRARRREVASIRPRRLGRGGLP